MIYSWILDSGGTGRGAWQGGVIYEFIRWCRENGCFPTITMGASAGGYAAADVATGTEKTVMKGWTFWGKQHLPRRLRNSHSDGIGGFRAQLRSSIRYVMEEEELSGVFGKSPVEKLLVFTTRVRRKDLKPFGPGDRLRFFFKSATRKLPRTLKYLPGNYAEEPVLFATNLPAGLRSEYIRPLTPGNYHAVIEASCLVPVAMGPPLLPRELQADTPDSDGPSVFMDGGYALKMPMRLFEEDARFQALARWVSADKTIIFCCDPAGMLWETSSRLRSLNNFPSVTEALCGNRLLVISPDHKVEAGFLCTDNAVAMRTFQRGQEQAQCLLRSENVRRFFEA